MLADARRNVVLIGPGAGISKMTKQYVLAALAVERKVVLNADTLTSFVGSSEVLSFSGGELSLYHDTP